MRSLGTEAPVAVVPIDADAAARGCKAADSAEVAADPVIDLLAPGPGCRPYI